MHNKLVFMKFCRIAVFQFLINVNVNTPTISFISEDPDLQYVSFLYHVVKLIKSILYSFRISSWLGNVSGKTITSVNHSTPKEYVTNSCTDRLSLNACLTHMHTHAHTCTHMHRRSRERTIKHKDYIVSWMLLVIITCCLFIWAWQNAWCMQAVISYVELRVRVVWVGLDHYHSVG